MDLCLYLLEWCLNIFSVTILYGDFVILENVFARGQCTRLQRKRGRRAHFVVCIRSRAEHMQREGKAGGGLEIVATRDILSWSGC